MSKFNLPLEATKWSDGESVAIHDAKGNWIADCVLDHDSETARPEDVMENAKAIVRCANHFDDLLTVASDARATMYRWAESCPEKWDERDELTLANLNDALDRLRAAGWAGRLPTYEQTASGFQSPR